MSVQKESYFTGIGIIRDQEGFIWGSVRQILRASSTRSTLLKVVFFKSNQKDLCVLQKQESHTGSQQHDGE